MQNKAVMLSESNKYLATPYVFIPVGADTFHVYRAYGDKRIFTCELRADAIPQWLESDFIRLLKQYKIEKVRAHTENEERMAKRTALRERLRTGTVVKLDPFADLDLDLNLDIELDL